MGVAAVGTGVSFVRATTSCVTNASLNVEVGVIGTAVFVFSMTGGRGVSVAARVGTGEEVAGMPPRGVGVAYCPHNEAFPLHADAVNKKDAAIKKLISRFTEEVRW